MYIQKQIFRCKYFDDVSDKYRDGKGILIDGNESQHAIVPTKVEYTMLQRCSSGYVSDPRIMYLEQEVEKDKTTWRH